MTRISSAQRSRIALLIKMAIVVIGATAVTLSPASSQLPAFPASGARYDVAGEFQGEAMDPWSATWEVRDTTVNGKTLVAVTHSTLQSNGGSFTATVLLDSRSTRAVQFFGHDIGRAQYLYDVSFAAGRMRGSVQTEGTSSAVDIELPDSAVPDFAVGHVLAARQLKDGDSVKVLTFLFQSSTGRAFRNNLSATVSSSTFRRAGSPADEAVWLVTGYGSYPAKYVIAKSDRAVLQMVVPQGTVGSETDTYAGKIPR